MTVIEYVKNLKVGDVVELKYFDRTYSESPMFKVLETPQTGNGYELAQVDDNGNEISDLSYCYEFTVDLATSIVFEEGEENNARLS